MISILDSMRAGLHLEAGWKVRSNSMPLGCPYSHFIFSPPLTAAHIHCRYDLVRVSNVKGVAFFHQRTEQCTKARTKLLKDVVDILQEVYGARFFFFREV
jgi:hypothetical protein